MNKRITRIISIVALICFSILALSSCAQRGSGYATDYAADKSLESDKYDDAVDWAEIQVAKIIIGIEKEKIGTPEYSNEFTLEQLVELETKLSELVLNANSEKDYADVVLKINSMIKTENDQAKLKTRIKELMRDYPDYDFISGVNTKGGTVKVDKRDNNFKVVLIKADIERYYEIIDGATNYQMLSVGVASNTTLTSEAQARTDLRNKFVKAFERKTGCLSGGGSLTNQSAVEISNLYKEDSAKTNGNVYEIVAAFMLDVEMRQIEQEPIHFKLSSFGEFFSNFFDNFFVFPVGIVLWFMSSIFGGWYIIGLVITTILIRTAGWPIYAKTNDMSLKMQVIQPEMQKLEEKYANRQDPDSQRMKQAELAQIYRKNKIGLGGCFLPFLQFPIFMAVYGAVRRFPYTVATEGTMFKLDWANTTLFGSEMKSTLFGLPFDLFEDYTLGTGQLIGIIVLVILVCGTQFLSQFLSERRQKTNHERAQEDIPAYRRQAYKQQNANPTQNSMKYVMYMMIFMMGTFVFTSKAGLGVYWLIGNVYSMLQMFINNEMGQKKLKKMKENANPYR